MTTATDGPAQTINADLAYLRTAIVNVYFYGYARAGDRRWVLVDAGIRGSAQQIRDAAEARFGPGARPAAIVLTHGHFDHVGALEELAEAWDCPVYAHALELPYLTGRSSYPPPDPLVGGGGMAALSFLYPRGPIDLGGRVRALPQDGSVPAMPGWRWLHTPGHTPGHVSLFRVVDGTLLAGDAVITTRQESVWSVATQKPEIHGPPMYYTADWGRAETSLRALAALEPATLATGHGVPMRGPALRAELHALARDFRARAMPQHGRYVDRPAIANRSGTVWVPPRGTGRTVALALIGAGALLTLAALLVGRER